MGDKATKPWEPEEHLFGHMISELQGFECSELEPFHIVQFLCVFFLYDFPFVVSCVNNFKQSYNHGF